MTSETLLLLVVIVFLVVLIYLVVNYIGMDGPSNYHSTFYDDCSLSGGLDKKYIIAIIIFIIILGMWYIHSGVGFNLGWKFHDECVSSGWLREYILETSTLWEGKWKCFGGSSPFLPR